MKKSMIFLLCMVSTLVSVIFGMNEKYLDYLRLDSIDKQENYFSIYIDESNVSIDDFLNELSAISNSYNASIIRTDILDEEEKSITYKSGVFTKEYLNTLNQYIIEGRTLKQDSDVISTFLIGNKNQVGKINDLFDDDPMIVTTLSNYLKNKNQKISGTYTICCDLEDKDAILDKISSYLNQDTADLLASNYTKTFSRGPIELIVAASVILLIVYTLMCLFYPTTQIKKIGVYKLLGFKTKDIWKELNLTNLIILFVFVLISVIFQKIYIPSLDLSYLLKLFTLQMIVFIISLLLSGIMMLVTKRYTLSSILKGFFHVKASLIMGYVLKFVTFTSMLFVIPYLADTIDTFALQISVKNSYEKVSNMITLTSYEYVDDEFQQIINGESILKNKFLGMFQELEKTADAQYFSFINMDQEYLMQMKNYIFGSRNIEEDEDYSILKINENGLESFQNWFDISVENYFKSDDLVILVPSIYQNDPKMDYVYRLILNSLSNPNIPIDIQYYQSNQEKIFTQNQQMIDKGKAFIQNPIFVCLSNNYIVNEAPLLFSDAATNPIRIERNNHNKQAIKTAIKNADLQKNQLEFDSILNTSFKDYMQVVQLGIAIASIGLILIVLVDILASYYILLILLVTRNKEIFVKKILGYYLIERYKNELFYFTVLYAMSMLELILTGQKLFSLVILVFLILLDLLVMYLMVKFKEKKNINMILKGEE